MRIETRTRLTAEGLAFFFCVSILASFRRSPMSLKGDTSLTEDVSTLLTLHQQTCMMWHNFDELQRGVLVEPAKTFLTKTSIKVQTDRRAAQASAWVSYIHRQNNTRGTTGQPLTRYIGETCSQVFIKENFRCE